MRVVDGITATAGVVARPDGPPVLVLTTFDDDEMLSGALRAGANGFILKDSSAEDLVAAVRTVAEGGSWLDPAGSYTVTCSLRTDAGFGAAPGSAAWLLSVSGAVGAVAGIGVGMMVDRLGPRRMAVLGLAVQAVASAGGAWAAQPTALLASRVVEGLGFQLVVVAVPVLIAGATPARSRATAMAAWSTFMPVGLALALLSGPWLAPTGWAPVWWFASAVAFAVAAAVARLTPELQRPAGVARRSAG